MSSQNLEKVQYLIELLFSEEKLNIYLVGAKDWGFESLIERTLRVKGGLEDYTPLSAQSTSIDRLREIVRNSDQRSHGSMSTNLVALFNTQELRRGSEGVLLKVMEESKTTRFLIHTSWDTPVLETVKSRSVFIQIPFLSREETKISLDYMSIDEDLISKFWDGTMLGTLRKIGAHQKIEELKSGIRTKVVQELDTTDVQDDDVFEEVFLPLLKPIELSLLERRRLTLEEKMLLGMRVLIRENSTSLKKD